MRAVIKILCNLAARASSVVLERGNFCLGKVLAGFQHDRSGETALNSMKSAWKFWWRIKLRRFCVAAMERIVVPDGG